MSYYPSAHRLQDREGRLRRAARIARVLEDLGGVDLSVARLLDVGASHGLITLALAERSAAAVGVDVDREGIFAAASEPGSASFAIASGMQLPFSGESFDIVICNHIYEHVLDAPRMMAEIARVLRAGGSCYFAGGHRLQLIEPHQRLPFLSWLPRGMADAWLRWLGRGARYEEHFLMPWQVKGLFTAFSSARDVTPNVLRACARFGLGPAWLESLFRWVLPLPLARLVAGLLPTQLWLLRK